MRFAVVVGAVVAWSAIASADCPKGERTRFALLDRDHRAEIEKALARTLPQNARVTVDATGMADTVTFELPGAHTGDDLRADVLKLVRANACAFGVIDPSDLEAVAQPRAIVVVEKPRRIGAIRVTVDGRRKITTVTLRGHLWPVAPPGKIDTRAAIASYVGRPIEVELKSPEPRLDGVYVREVRKIQAADLVASPGPVLACSKSFVDVVAAVHVDFAHAFPLIVGTSPLPAVVDAAGKPVAAGWIAPVVVEPGADWAQPDRADAAGRTCLNL
jgi:hypothetical protein